MHHYCIANLNDIKHVVLKLSHTQYTQPSTSLFGASIGQHVRHVLEFYQSLFSGLQHHTVDYDHRKRNLLIETDTAVSAALIDDLCALLNSHTDDRSLTLIGNFCANDTEASTSIKTTYLRELAYCLEHSIHHQALIKVGLLELNCLNYINESFGLAPATLRHIKTCAQ